MNFENIEKLEKEYLKQYPNLESPFNWSEQVYILDIFDFVKNRKGRKIGLKTEKEVLGVGELIYIK